jgi:CheY-like chemotaxis protein
VVRVLVVDDVEEMRVLIRRALGARGYAVDVAGTLAEARGMDPGRYDALLIDAHLRLAHRDPLTALSLTRLREFLAAPNWAGPAPAGRGAPGIGHRRIPAQGCDGLPVDR